MSQAGSSSGGGGGGGGGILRYLGLNYTPYAVASTDQVIGVDTTSLDITIQLPDSPETGRVIIIKDATGNASNHNITVTTVSGVVLIDGATTLVMNSDYESIQFLYTGTEYLAF